MSRSRFVAVFAAGALATLNVGGLGASAGAQPLPLGHDFEGLPATPGPIAAYAADVKHPLNRLHALMFFAVRTPTEIGATLPAERRRDGKSDTEFFTAKWALTNRTEKQITADADARLFGGDVRTSPVAKWTEAEATEARAILATLATPEAAAKVVAAPLARLSLQWDLLQLWWRFEREQSADAATLQAMARAIRALGQARAELAALPSGLAALEAAGWPATKDRHQPHAPRGLLGGADSPWVEVDRVPAALFSAQRALISARVFLKSSDRATVEALVAQVPVKAAQKELVTVPRGTEAALVLAMIGLTGELEPVATPVVSELRVRMAVAPDVLDPASDTSTRDGWNQWVWLFSRSAALTQTGQPPLRFVPDTAQSLFLEYGSPKHTTYFAQCALCHRTTNAGNQKPSGMHVLGLYAKPSVLTDPAKRGRDAEAQMAPVIAKLKARLADGGAGK
jgi:hypothetical protein